MDYMQGSLEWGTPSEKIAGMLRDAAAALEKAARLVDGTEDDKLAWIDHKTVQSKFEAPLTPFGDHCEVWSAPKSRLQSYSNGNSNSNILPIAYCLLPIASRL